MDSSTTVVNMRWMSPGDIEGEQFVRVDRATRWGNPFRIGQDGTREQVVAKYRELLWSRIESGEVTVSDLLSLRGKALCCWCVPEPCHANVLVRAVGWAEAQEALQALEKEDASKTKRKGRSKSTARDNSPNKKKRRPTTSREPAKAVPEVD